MRRLKRSFFPWMLHHALEFWHYYIGALLSLFLLHWIQSQLPLMAKDLGDFVMNSKIEQIPLKEFILMAIGIVVFRTLSRLLFFYPARIQQKTLRIELLEELEEAPPERWSGWSSGQIYQVLFNDINRLRSLIGFGLLQVGNIIIALSVFIPKIEEFHPSFLIALLPMVLSVGIFSLIIYLFQPMVKKTMDYQGEVQNFIIESYNGKATIKNYQVEDAFIKKFEAQSYRELANFFKSSIGPVISIPMIRLGFGISLLWGAWIIYQDHLAATSLIFFSGFLYLVMEPIASVSWIGVVVSQSYASWKRIKELLAKLDKPSKEEQLEHLQFWGKQVDLTWKENSWNIIAGETGCGKSHLLKEVARILNLKGESYCLVEQEPYLFNTSVGENIALGKIIGTSEKKKLQDLLDVFGLQDIAIDSDSILEVEVGENGKKVSGGQAKRIALIRSLFSQASWIIWDDPFSSIDPIHEANIIKFLQQEEQFQNKTFILTSHRLTTVRFCKYGVLLEKEQGVIEEGDIPQILEEGFQMGRHFAKQNI